MDEKINVRVRLERSSIHELSQPIFGDMPVYPGEPQPELQAMDKMTSSNMIKKL